MKTVYMFMIFAFVATVFMGYIELAPVTEGSDQGAKENTDKIEEDSNSVPSEQNTDQKLIEEDSNSVPSEQNTDQKLIEEDSNSVPSEQNTDQKQIKEDSNPVSSEQNSDQKPTSAESGDGNKRPSGPVSGPLNNRIKSSKSMIVSSVKGVGDLVGSVANETMTFAKTIGQGTYNLVKGSGYALGNAGGRVVRRVLNGRPGVVAQSTEGSSSDIN